MLLLKEIFSGYAMRIRKENGYQLTKMEIVRPRQVALEIVKANASIDAEIQDPALKKQFDDVLAKLTAPTAV